MYGNQFYVFYFIIIRLCSSIQQPMDWNITTLLDDLEDTQWTKLNETEKTKTPSDSDNNKNAYTGLNETRDFPKNGVMERVKSSWNYNQNVNFSDYYNFVSLNRSRDSYKRFLPKGWSEFCFVSIGRHIHNFTDKLIWIKCIPENNNHFDFLSFRNFTSDFNETSLEFALEIKCKSWETRISLPWPMRADLLKYISVESCAIENYKREFFDESNDLIPDTLEYIKIAGVNIMTQIDDLLWIHQQNKTITRTADCGPTNAYIVIMRNITYTLNMTSTIPPTEYFRILSQGTKNMVRDLSVAKYTCDYKNLWLLDRSHCSTMGVHTNIFQLYNARLPKLEVLNLSYTLMAQIPEKLKDWRLHFPALTYLDLSHNNISDFSSIKDHGSKSKNPAIGTIDLKFNNITTISERSIETCLRRAKFFKVDIRNNPFICKCKMKYFVDFMRLNKNLTAVNFENHEYFNSLTCSNPYPFIGRVIVDLNNENLGCELNRTKMLTAPIILLSVVITILITLVLFTIRYRKNITIFAFTRLNIVIPCQHSSSDADKKFDAFIAYSQHDAEWVLKTLTPRLENASNPYPFKVCLHHRDFALGAPISDNIIKSVEISRHTVLVISKNFLKSEWCLLEFRTALQQSLLERNRHLIMIILEDIPTQEVDSDLKRCLQTLTYVKADDRWFWDKLIYAISDKNRKKQHSVKIRTDHVIKPTKENNHIVERL